jgi:hypothetical protein
MVRAQNVPGQKIARFPACLTGSGGIFGWSGSGGGLVVSKPDNPCYQCPDRYTACSDYCRKPEFIAWKEEQERIREARRKYDETTSYTVDQIRKSRRAR